MHFFVLIKSFVLSVPNNIPLALCFIALYLFISFCSYRLSFLVYKRPSFSKYTIFFPLFFAALWLYGELRCSAIITYPYDTEGFIYDSYSIWGSLIVLVSTAALLGNLVFWLIHHKVKR